MKKPLVTIIIPFYNEELLLERAISSAVEQTYARTQILLVNDGSRDNSRKVGERFANKYEHVELLNTSNQGLGAARNNGVAIAKGSLITFLDADDALRPEMVEKMVNALLQQQSDIAICKFYLYGIEGEKLDGASFTGGMQLLESIEAIQYIYGNRISSTAWGKMYKMAIIKDIKAPEKIWFEDDSFVLETLLNCSKVSVLDEPLLQIYSRPESIVRRLVTARRIKDFNTSFQLQLQLLNKFKSQLKNQYNILTKGLFKYYYSRLLTDLIMIFSDFEKLDPRDRSAIKVTYLSVIDDTKRKQKQNKVRLSFKSRLLTAMLSSPKHLGWSVPRKVLCYLKADQFRRLKKLRGAQ